MRILIHDYAGHALHVQLSRWLAAQGHSVLHCYCADMETPRGHLLRRPGDADGFAVEALSLGRAVPKYSPVRRWLYEARYARQVARRALDFAPDVVMTANAPPQIQQSLARAARQAGALFVNWLQDIVSVVAEPILRRRLPVVGGLAARYLRRKEFAVLAASDRIIAITEGFVPLCVANKAAPERITVIPNWAPLDDLPLVPRDNPWSRRHGLDGKTVFLYAGTLGLKHDPGLLAELAAAHAHRPDVVVVVVSQGIGRSWLEAEKDRRNLNNLLLMDYQSFDEMPLVLGSADIVVALLEQQAGVMSVPSKVMSYLCSGRPILAAIPPENLAFRTIAEAGGGLLSAPGDRVSFLAQAQNLLDDPHLRRNCGDAGRAYAERVFDMDVIGARFLDVLSGF